MEERWCERWTTDFPVLLKIGESSWMSGRIRDIGSGGVFVKTSCRDAPHSRVVIRTPESSNAFLERDELSCQVVHSDEQGMGLMFTDVDRSNLPTLERLLKQARLRARSQRPSAS